MNKFTIWPVTAGLIVWVAAGCSGGDAASGSGYKPKAAPQLSSAWLPADKQDSYYPFQEGNQWVFDSQTTNRVNGRVQASTKEVVTYRIDKVSSVAGGTEAKFSVFSGSKLNNYEVWRVDKEKGIYLVSLGKDNLHPINPMQLMVPFPVKDHGPVEWSGDITTDQGTIRHTKMTVSVHGEEQIDTEMGVYNAVGVASEGGFAMPNGSTKMSTKLWLVPNVGIGRYLIILSGDVKSTDPKLKGQSAKFDFVQLMVLKNATLKK